MPDNQEPIISEPLEQNVDNIVGHGLTMANPTQIPLRRDAIRSIITLGIVLVLMCGVIVTLVIYYHQLVNDPLLETALGSSSTSSGNSSTTVAKTGDQVIIDNPIYYSVGDSMYRLAALSGTGERVGPGGQISPDKTQIVYNLNGSGGVEVAENQFILYDIPSQQQTVISSTEPNSPQGSYSGFPKFSPNGKFIYSIFSNEAKGTLSVFDVDTHEKFYSDSVWYNNVSWDGDTIVYAQPITSEDAPRPFYTGDAGSIVRYDFDTKTLTTLINPTRTKDYGIIKDGMFGIYDLPHKLYLQEVNFLLDDNNIPASYANRVNSDIVLDTNTKDTVSPDNSFPLIQVRDLVQTNHPGYELRDVILDQKDADWYLLRFINSDSIDLYYIVNLTDIQNTLGRIVIDSGENAVTSISW